MNGVPARRGSSCSAGTSGRRRCPSASASRSRRRGPRGARPDPRRGARDARASSSRPATAARSTASPDRDGANEEPDPPDLGVAGPRRRRGGRGQLLPRRRGGRAPPLPRRGRPRLDGARRERGARAGADGAAARAGGGRDAVRPPPHVRERGRRRQARAHRDRDRAASAVGAVDRLRARDQGVRRHGGAHDPRARRGGDGHALRRAGRRGRGHGHPHRQPEPRSAAEELAARIGGRAVPWEDLPSALPEADVVVGTTASPEPVVAQRGRRGGDARAARPSDVLPRPRHAARLRGRRIGDDLQRVRLRARRPARGRRGEPAAPQPGGAAGRGDPRGGARAIPRLVRQPRGRPDAHRPAGAAGGAARRGARPHPGGGTRAVPRLRRLRSRRSSCTSRCGG